MAQSIQIDVVLDEAGFRDLEPEWNPLLQRSSSNSVFLTFEYLHLWWEVYGKDYRLFIFTARDEEGRLIGIAPMMSGFGHVFPRKLFRHLTFMGGLGDSLAEYQDFIVEPGLEAEVTPRLYESMIRDVEADWDLLFLPLVNEESAVLPHLLKAIPEHGAYSFQLSSRPSPNIPLPGDWDEFLRSKSKNFKKQFKNQWNRLHKNHCVEWVEADRDISIEDAMKVLTELNLQRWGDAGKAFKSDAFSEFHQRLAESFREKDWLYLRLLKVDGQWAGARYDYVYGGKLWNYQNGWLPQMSNLSLGKLLIGHSVQWCIEQGLKEYDFLAGDSSYKLSWATRTRHLLTIEILNPASRKAAAFEQLRMLRSLMDSRKQANQSEAEAA